MTSLTRILRRCEGEGVYRFRGVPLLCARTFAKLMNEAELPDKIRVTISSEPIRGAARVPVRISGWYDWIDWRGVRELLHPAPLLYLRKLGLPEDKWTDIWVDWAPV